MSFIRASLHVGGATLASRILGFARDVLFAATLGTSQQADAFLAAFRLPNLFRRLFAEGAFAAAFVPVLAQVSAKQGADEARRFAGDALFWLVLLLCALTLAAEVFMPFLVRLIAGGFADTPDKFAQTIFFARIVFPYLLCMALCALYGGVLNATGRFLAAAAAPMLLNLALIGALLFVYATARAEVAGVFLSWGVLVAGLWQVALLVFAAARVRQSPVFARPRLTPEIRQMATLALPVMLAGGVMQINILIGTRIASAQDGALAILYYAERLYQLPLGVIGIALGVVLLPQLSHLWEEGRAEAARARLDEALLFAMLLTLPAAAALFIIPDVVLRALFEYGAFTAADTEASADVLAAFAWGLPAFVLVRLAQPAFFARKDTARPLRYAVVAIIVNTALALFLFPQYGATGIAVATSIGAGVHALALGQGLWRAGVWNLSQPVGSRLLRIAAAALVMGGVLYAARAALVGVAPILTLLLLVLFGLAIYAAACHILRAARISDIRESLRHDDTK